MALNEWQTELLTELETELGVTEQSDIAILESKLNSAIREVKNYRGYSNTSLEADEIDTDLQEYAHNIKDLAMYDYCQIGIEGQVSYSENGISRKYKDRSKCLNGVDRFVKL